MRLAVGGDHAGYILKGQVVELLRMSGHTIEDFGTFSREPVDFPDITLKICNAVRHSGYERGILACGTGVGACIAANKIPGIRAALCHDTYSAHQCVEHDDVNVLCLGAQIIGINLAQDILQSFLHAKFSDQEDFRRRVAKLLELERQAARELSTR